MAVAADTTRALLVTPAEVELTHPLGDALRVYGAIGIPEVWRFGGESLRFFILNADGSYSESETSRSFPALRTRDALDWLSRAEGAEPVAWSIEVEAWARGELAARADPRAG